MRKIVIVAILVLVSVTGCLGTGGDGPEANGSQDDEIMNRSDYQQGAIAVDVLVRNSDSGMTVEWTNEGSADMLEIRNEQNEILATLNEVGGEVEITEAGTHSIILVSGSDKVEIKTFKVADTSRPSTGEQVITESTSEGVRVTWVSGSAERLEIQNQRGAEIDNIQSVGGQVEITLPGSYSTVLVNDEDEDKEVVANFTVEQ